MRLIEHWRPVVWRSATSRVSTVLGFLVGALAHTYGAAFAILPFLPFQLQLPLAGLLGAIVVAGPIILARVTEQPKLEARCRETPDAGQ